VEWGGYCIGPDCEPDLNYNGIPDPCDDCGDLDADADVDMDDYWVILAAFGTCAGDLNYVVEADADDDHCITLMTFGIGGFATCCERAGLRPAGAGRRRRPELRWCR
jgi:hypothetical protein